MLGTIMEMIIYLIVSLLAVKLVFFSSMSKKAPEEVSTNWKSAADTMTVMESRIQLIQERDIKQQERIWALEDINRDLQARLAKTTKELMLVSHERRDKDEPTNVDDDDDRHSSIPPSN